MHQKTRKRQAPEEIKRLKRELGLDKQFLAQVKSYVRFEKIAQQIIGQDQTAPIVWGSRVYNVGGGGYLATNRLIVPERFGGLWRIRAVLNLDGATVKPNANYRVELWVNDVLQEFESNQAVTARQMSARFFDEVWLEEADEVQIQLTNNVTSGTVTVDIGSYMSAQFMGTI
jgi:hypothetical protein